MNRSIFFILCILVISGCKQSSPPKDVLQKEKMKEVIWDVMQAQMLAQQITLTDTSLNLVDETNALTLKVFEYHHTNKEQFDKSYDWYLKNPKDLNEILDSLYLQKSRIEIPVLEKPKTLNKLQKPNHE